VDAVPEDDAEEPIEAFEIAERVGDAGIHWAAMM